jgi:hypothetical protein
MSDIDNSENPQNESTDWEKELQALRRNNEQLLSEKKKAQTKAFEIEQQLNQIGGAEGIQKLLELQKKAQDDTQKELLSQGKFDELMKNSIEQQKAQYEAKMQAFNEEKEKLRSDYDSLQHRVRSMNINSVVKSTCEKLNLQETAHFDIALHVMNDCRFDEHNNPIFIDENGNTRFNKQGDKFSIEDYINEQRRTYKHWEKPSTYGAGTGSYGSQDLMKANQSAKEWFSMLKSNK